MADQDQAAEQPEAKKPEQTDNAPKAAEAAPKAPEPAPAEAPKAAAAASPVPAHVSSFTEALKTKELYDLETKSDDDDASLEMSPVEVVAYRGTQNVHWDRYADIRRLQKQIAAQEFQQKYWEKAPDGAAVGRLGFIPLDQNNRHEMMRFQQEHFGSFYQDETDAQRIEAKNKRDAELKSEGKSMGQDELARYTLFADKLVRGFRIDHSTGVKLYPPYIGETMGMAYQIGEGATAQHVYDRNGVVSARTAGTFTAKTAMAMAMVYQGNRRLGPDGLPRQSMAVNIKTRSDRKLFGGGVSGDHKANLLILNNIHLANRAGTALDLTVNGQNPDLKKLFDQNPTAMTRAIEELDFELLQMKEPGIIERDKNGQPVLKDPQEAARQAYENLIERQNTIRRGLDMESVTLSDPAAQEKAPEPSNDDQAAAPEAAPDGAEPLAIEGPKALKALPAPEAATTGDANDSPAAAAEDEALASALNEDDKPAAGALPAPLDKSGELGDVVPAQDDDAAAGKDAPEAAQDEAAPEIPEAAAPEAEAVAEAPAEAAPEVGTADKDETGVTAKEAVGDNKTEVGKDVPLGTPDPAQAKTPAEPQQNVDNVLTAAGNKPGGQTGATPAAGAPKDETSGPATTRSLPAPPSGKRGLGS